MFPWIPDIEGDASQKHVGWPTRIRPPLRACRRQGCANSWSKAQKGLAFARKWSATVAARLGPLARGIPAPLASRPLRGCSGGGICRHQRMEDSVKLTDTQLALLSAASRRNDRALERPANLTGGSAA